MDNFGTTIQKNLLIAPMNLNRRHGICQLSIVPVRANPSSKEEMVTQLLFGETYFVTESQGEWLKIESADDAYEGWINELQHTDWDQDAGQAYLVKDFPFLEASIENTLERIFLLPGSQLQKTKIEGNHIVFQINNTTYKAHFEVSKQGFFTFTEMKEFALNFISAPYLWGGRTLFGMDCSGFTQLLYKLRGVQLHRDAWQQALLGADVAFLNEVKLGDLAFFDNEEGKITHVGMILENGEIIHASGKVRIDKLDSYGIFDEKKGSHSHKLRTIRRIIP
jgi:cell wall-associated NlpC family hydrolase